jgi:hypothetical protein
MNALTPTRQQIIELIDNLPEDTFPELITFIGYLRYKAVETKTEPPHNSFLLSIVGLGDSTERDISEGIQKAGIDLEQFKNDVYRKIGRNVMLLQKIEMLLKYLLSRRDISGYSNEIKIIADKKLEYYDNKNMGQLLEDFFKEDISSAPPEILTGVWISFNIMFEKDVNLKKKSQESFDLLRKNRNILVHNSLPNWDYLNSIEGCESACIDLDHQYDNHIKPTFHCLKAYTEMLQEGFQEGIKELVDKLTNDFLVNSSLIYLLSEIAGQKLRPDGWISLDVAISTIKKQSPEDLNSLEQKFGFKKLKDLMKATNLFEFSEESTKKGGRRILYRNISS